MALMRPDHPLAARSAVRFAELAVEPFVGLSGSMALQQLYRREAEALGLVLRERVNVASFDGVRLMVEAGFGVAVLPAIAAEPHASAKLVIRPWTSPGPNDRWRSSPVAIRATCPQPRGCSLHTFSNALLQAPGAAGPLPRDPLALARHRAKRKSARGSIYCVSRRRLKMVEPLGVGLSLTMGKQSHWAHVRRAHSKHRRSC